MIDFQLNQSNDWSFDALGNLIKIGGADALSQRLQIRLNILEGQWFRDVNLGIPWIEQVLVRNPNLAEIRASFELEILQVPEVLRIEDFEIDFDAQESTLNIEFIVVTAEQSFEATAVADNWPGVITLLLLQPLGSI